MPLPMNTNSNCKQTQFNFHQYSPRIIKPIKTLPYGCRNPYCCIFSFEDRNPLSHSELHPVKKNS